MTTDTDTSSGTRAPADPRQRYLDDFRAGETFEFGPVTVTEAEIIEFGRRFDPQPFHVDPVAAAASSFGGLVAVGWHTCLIGYRLAVDGFLQSPNLIAGLGVDEIRLLAPVRPGAVLTVQVTVDAVIPSRSTPGRGVLSLALAVIDRTIVEQPLTAATYGGRMLWRRTIPTT